MVLRNAIEEISGLRYMAEGLELRTGLSRRVLLESPFLRTRQEIECILGLVDKVYAAFADERLREAIENITLKLERVKDLRGTIEKLRGAMILGDVEFFELKVLAMTLESVRGLMNDAELEVVEVPALDMVVSVLDPDNTGIPHFSVYDSYSDEIAGVRKKIKKLRQKGETGKQLDELNLRNAELEDKIRGELSGRLRGFAEPLDGAMNAAAALDILIAKASQAHKVGLNRPAIVQQTTRYEGLFNPMLRDNLRASGKDFQAVDIAVGDGPTLITGANMGGKTVLLRTVALAQALVQYGFYVPAARSQVVPADRIMTAIGDGQNEMTGLSSFAAEMVRLNGMIAQVKSGCKPLVVIDEPARTTNPAEGEAIVNALLDFLADNNVRSLVTSHYGGLNKNVKRLRVRGFVEGAPAELTVNNIQEHMDYSLVQDDGKPPREALRIARMLGVDEALIETAAGYLKESK